jgi:hypothetical protein
MLKHIKPFLFTLLLFSSILTWSQNFSASVSKSVLTEGERFKFILHIRTNGTKLSNPNFEGFKLLQGPIKESSYQIINGKTTQALTWSYILLASKVGSFTIPSVVLTTKEGEIKTEPIDIIVKKESPFLKKYALKGDYFILPSVSKKNIYKGEQLLLNYTFYTKVNGQLSQNKEPKLNGFWKKEIEKENEFSSVIINGENWSKGIIKQVILIPQKSGELLIDPIEITLASVYIKRDKWGRALSREQKKQTIKSNTIKINVKPFPSTPPSSFTGAVGEFRLSGTINKQEVLANDGIDYKIKITGAGNFHLFGKPDINFPNDFEVYDPKIKNNYKVKTSGTRGSKEWSYLVIPRFGGKFNIPVVAFTYFSPKKKKFITLKTDDFDISVSKGLKEENVTFRSQVNKQEVENLDQTIRYIHTSGKGLNKSSKSWFGSGIHYGLMTLAPLLVICGFLMKKQFDKQNSDTVGTKRKKANKTANKHLAEARKNRADESVFYTLLSKALYGYLSDKLSIPLSELNKEEIQKKLAVSLSEGDVNKLLETLDYCEMAKYAPVSTVTNEELLAKSEEIINQIEKL